MSVGRSACCGCVMSDGRFAVLGGAETGGALSSCEALVIGEAAHWEPISPMHDTRVLFACAAVAGCVIVARGSGRTSAEVYDMSRAIGGCGFRATCLTNMGWKGWAARFCRGIRERAREYEPRHAQLLCARVFQQSRANHSSKRTKLFTSYNKQQRMTRCK
jgi:hypothetical protein